MKNLLVVTAAIEAAVGATLALMPTLPIWLLLGTPPNSAAALVVARLVGLALLSLGVACWLASDDEQSRAARGVVAAMLLYHVTATALFIYTRIGLGLSGLALWPAVATHVVLAVWCVACLKQPALSAPARGSATL